MEKKKKEMKEKKMAEIYQKEADKLMNKKKKSLVQDKTKKAESMKPKEVDPDAEYKKIIAEAGKEANMIHEPIKDLITKYADIADENRN